MRYKPDGYTDVSPYLIVADIDAALAFVQEVFQGAQLRYHRHADGRPMHAEARIGDSVVMFGQSPGAPGAHVHVYVADVRAVYEAALAAGAQSVQPPADQNDGDLRAGFTDPVGTTWWPSTQISIE